MKTVFAIDPGPTHSAYAEWREGELLCFEKLENFELLEHLQATLDNCEVRFVCEMIASYGMAVGREVFETCVWIGRFHETLRIRGYDMSLVYRRDVKLHLCNSAKAKDANIIQALKDRFGDKGTKANPGVFYGVSGDVWQAIALAVTVYDKGAA